MRRKEDPRLITGRASYVDDITLVRATVGGVGALARGAREDRLDRHLRSARPRRHPGGLHQRRPRHGGGPADGLGPARRGGQHARPLGTGQGRGQARGRSGRARGRRRPLRGGRRGRGRRRRVRPAARRHRSGEGARGGITARPPAVRDQQGLRLVARRRRSRGRVRRGRCHHRAPRRQPSHGGRGDRTARRAGRMARRQADGLELDTGSALPAPVPGDPARGRRGPGPSDRPGGRWRLRVQAPDLRRGDRMRLGVAQAGARR